MPPGNKPILNWYWQRPMNLITDRYFVIAIMNVLKYIWFSMHKLLEYSCHDFVKLTEHLLMQYPGSSFSIIKHSNDIPLYIYNHYSHIPNYVDFCWFVRDIISIIMELENHYWLSKMLHFDIEFTHLHWYKVLWCPISRHLQHILEDELLGCSL